MLMERAVPAGDAREISREKRRRLNPRLTDTDWLLLRRLRSAVEEAIDGLVRPGQTALDFGCGSRPYEPLFVEREMAYLGADFGPGSELRIGPDGRMDAASGSADMVLSFQVLEHVRDLQTYFAEARRVLRPDGWMLLSTHGTWFYHPHPEDHRRWTREGLINDIEANGFQVVQTTAVVGPLAWTTMIRLTALCFALRRVPVLGGPAAAVVAAVTNLRIWAEEAITPGWVTRDNACVYLTLSRPRAG
jgi:SAM-dependent methyltransferase